MAETVLSLSQIKQIKIDLGEGKEFLTDEEVLVLAKKAKESLPIKIPFLSDEKQLTVLFKFIRVIDRQLYKLLPNEYYELIRDVTNGITEEDAKELRIKLTKIINKLIDIPVLPDAVEAFIIDFVLGIIINAMVNGFDLNKAVAVVK